METKLYTLPPSDLDRLFTALARQGYSVVGPTVRDGAIVYDELSSSADLPTGLTDEQDGGKYRLLPRTDAALFGYAVGPHSWKKFLFPPVSSLWKADRTESGFTVTANTEAPKKYAFLGVRSCELHAIAIQDKVFMNGQFVDPGYKARRENAFFVAINCSQSGGTCFCVSMNTGPKVSSGFDLALTEVLEGGAHYFVIESGSLRGEEIIKELRCVEALAEQARAAEAVIAETALHMGRAMDTTGIKDLLYHNREHPRWLEVAARCETCANCTMVCPTCFCSTVEDTTDLTGDHAERWRKWDSCFTMDFSYIHGGSVRATPEARYRHWMTHKLGSWFDQFGTSGCVGCGRCITWCPVGIDITEEVRAIRQSDGARNIPEANHGSAHA